jgi:hypothetical protein
LNKKTHYSYFNANFIKYFIVVMNSKILILNSFNFQILIIID